MIKLLQNALTQKKGSLNFMDQNGKVVGFNPRPDGNPLAFDVYRRSGELVDTEGTFIEDYLDGLPYCFGNDGHIIKHGAGSEEDDKLVISLVPDNAEEPLTLQIICMNSLYYTASFVLSDEDRLLFGGGGKTLAQQGESLGGEINRALAELASIRGQIAKVMADLNGLNRKVAALAAAAEQPGHPEG